MYFPCKPLKCYKQVFIKRLLFYAIYSWGISCIFYNNHLYQVGIFANKIRFCFFFSLVCCGRLVCLSWWISHALHIKQVRHFFLLNMSKLHVSPTWPYRNKKPKFKLVCHIDTRIELTVNLHLHNQYVYLLNTHMMLKTTLRLSDRYCCHNPWYMDHVLMCHKLFSCSPLKSLF